MPCCSEAGNIITAGIGRLRFDIIFCLYTRGKYVCGSSSDVEYQSMLANDLILMNRGEIRTPYSATPSAMMCLYFANKTRVPRITVSTSVTSEIFRLFQDHRKIP